mgnify:CR=1 FL=1
MSHWDKLEGLSNNKNIDRNSILEKKIKDIQKVISNPDPWNANIASREYVEALEKRIEDLERIIREKFDGS